ncbi:MAG: hypothetical protein ACFE95_23200 [Candidatus Hodarchaeota archaeon]
MPIIHLGKRREALTGSAEAYKKKVIEYLDTQGYYIFKDSFIEGTFPDYILKRKDDEKEYWLEAKATTISLGEADFVFSLGKYLGYYLSKTEKNRFKMILAVHNYRNPDQFEAVYEMHDDSSIKKVIDFMLEQTPIKISNLIKKANFNEIKQFFEETEVIRADYIQLQEAIEKRLKKVPYRPKLPEADYAAEVLNRYSMNEPINEMEQLCSNLFSLVLPEYIYIGDTEYKEKRQIFLDYPEISFPHFRLLSNQIYSLCPIGKNSALGLVSNIDNIKKIVIKEWDVNIDTRNIVLYFLYRWVDDLCITKNLDYEERTKSYYFKKKTDDYRPMIIRWKKGDTRRPRKVVIPVMSNEFLYYWAHRAVNLYPKKLWGEYLIEIRPRWIFSGDGRNPYGGDTTDKLDRSYRKSNYNRNINQLNDVLFWYKFLFAESGLPLEKYSMGNKMPLIYVGDQVTVETSYKPNIKDYDEEYDFESVDPRWILDRFLGEDFL